MADICVICRDVPTKLVKLDGCQCNIHYCPECYLYINSCVVCQRSKLNELNQIDMLMKSNIWNLYRNHSLKSLYKFVSNAYPGMKSSHVIIEVICLILLQIAITPINPVLMLITSPYIIYERDSLDIVYKLVLYGILAWYGFFICIPICGVAGIIYYYLLWYRNNKRLEQFILWLEPWFIE